MHLNNIHHKFKHLVWLIILTFLGSTIAPSVALAGGSKSLCKLNAIGLPEIGQRLTPTDAYQTPLFIFGQN